MIKARAKATFRMQQSLIRRGDIFTADEEYLLALARNGLAEIIRAEEAAPANKKRGKKKK